MFDLLILPKGEGNHAQRGGGVVWRRTPLSDCEFNCNHPSTAPRSPSPSGRILVALLLAALPLPAFAQEHDHSQMDHSQMGHDDANGQICVTPWLIPSAAEGSGTSRLPGRESHLPGRSYSDCDGQRGLSYHGYLWGVHTEQSGPRGGNKSYVQSMGMIEWEKGTAKARIQLKSMFSLEPLMKNSGYPSLLATGETNNGNPLVDRQHPHDLFMELAARGTVRIAKDTELFLYGGPVGEPALGPSAFMHRGSAKLNPEAPITHHWFDSTHITYGVATAGVATDTLQLEGSIFTGREPDEKRWNIEKPRFDSWSVRATWNPSTKWALQASHGRIKEPEFLIHPGENEHRTTASAHYANGRGLSAMLAFSAKNRDPGRTLNAFLAEANWDIDDHHTVFGRIENVKNDELFPDDLNPLHEVPFRVSKFQAGYAYRLPLWKKLNLALGGSVSTFATPAALNAAYGKRPVGATVFAKLSLGH
jgi:hypothetical protein